MLLARGHGVCEIARQLGRAASTISREIRRNAATRSGNFDYRATTAQWYAERAARRPKVARLAANDMLRRWVEDWLSGAVAKPGAPPFVGPLVSSWKGRRHGPRQNRRWSTAWSPEQIAWRLPIDFPDDDSMRIVPATGDPTQVRIWNINTNAVIVATVPIKDGKAAVVGDLGFSRTSRRLMSCTAYVPTWQLDKLEEIGVKAEHSDRRVVNSLAAALGDVGTAYDGANQR